MGEEGRRLDRTRPTNLLGHGTYLKILNIVLQNINYCFNTVLSISSVILTKGWCFDFSTARRNTVTGKVTQQ